MDVKLPHLGEGADSGTVVNLLIKEGDPIEKNQPILELENEKAVATIPSTVAGVVARIYVKMGERISAGQKLISVTVEGAVPEPAATPESRKPAAVQPAAVAPLPAAAPAAVVVEEFSLPPDAPVNNADVPAAPSLRKMATDFGIDLHAVRGTGRGGRVLLADVRSYLQRVLALARQPKSLALAEVAVQPAQPAPVAEAIDFSKWGEITKKPMSSLRKVISRRMTENWTTIPHVTQFDEADITSLMDLRKQFAAEFEKQGTKLTLTPFLIKALADTLKQHPIFNSSLDETAGEIILKDYFHIGIAVDTEAGLMVPVIREVNRKSMVELSKELEELAKKARERKLTPDDMKGGTFTISNQGGIGSAHFTPIVNKPEVAILGLGRGALKPVVRNGQIEARTLLPIALSYDHRVIDGGSAARFTVDLVNAIQNFKPEAVK